MTFRPEAWVEAAEQRQKEDGGGASVPFKGEPSSTPDIPVKHTRTGSQGRKHRETRQAAEHMHAHVNGTAFPAPRPPLLRTSLFPWCRWKRVDSIRAPLPREKPGNSIPENPSEAPSSSSGSSRRKAGGGAEAERKQRLRHHLQAGSGPGPGLPLPPEPP